MSSRYLTGSQIPRPIMKIIPSSTDIIHKLKMGEHLSNLAQKFYNDPNLSWVIMSANRDYENEFEIPFGTDIRIPLPLTRIYSAWQITGDL